MTANLFVVLVQLLGILVSTGKSRGVRRWPFVVAALALVPLLWPPDVPLSHFLFEFSTRTIFVVVVIIAAALWLVAGLRVVRSRGARPRPVEVVLAVTLVIIAGWLVVGATVSDYERGGPTPTATDTPLWIVQAVTVWAVFVAELALVVWVTLLRRAGGRRR